MPKKLTPTSQQIASDNYFDGSKLPPYIFKEVKYYLLNLKYHPSGNVTFLDITKHKLCPKNYFGEKLKAFEDVVLIVSPN
jgi:hypothetical protein